MDEQPTKREYVSMKMLPDVIAAVGALANKENRSRSNMIEVLLQEALAARERPPKPGIPIKKKPGGTGS